MIKSRFLSGFQDNRQQNYCYQGNATAHLGSQVGSKLSIIHSPLCLWVLIANIFIHSCNAATPNKPMNDPEQLQSRLSAALKAKGTEYQARTHHLKDGQPIYTNRLILEDSPYLLQHAHNPVNWYPWGKEAFAQAQSENKPVFLSIGYATCHWCHVMEEESFESTAIAKILNDNFIAIKVDREQYPDIDQTYMTAVTMLTGHGGWPMSSFLTPEGKPFFGGTYFPPATFSDLLLQVDNAWKTQQQTLVEQAEKLAQAVHHASSVQEQISTLELSAVQSGVDNILSNYDSLNGGFGQAPKFPNEPLLLLLVLMEQRNPNQNLTTALNHTLSEMAQGGIYDQLGGGFHRYATDSQWLVPHFEKMLYNQAYLARVYMQAYQLTGNPLYARITRQTLDYALREMTTTSGGVFYSATDADSEGHEGSYFIWTEDEIKSLLTPEKARFIIQLFGITQQGNFEGKNILYLPESLDEFARHQDMTLDQLFQTLDPLLVTLRQHREKRIPPLTDDKIIVAWNGMLITALAEAGDLLQQPRYIEAAERAADTLWQSQRKIDGKLWRVNLNGQASIPARQDDYVHFSEALLALYDVAGNPARLQQAHELCDEMLDKFLDNTSGTLFMGQDELLFTQPKDGYDSALPSGNAVAVRVLSKLAKRTGDSAYSDKAAKILQAFSGDIIKHPAGYAYMLAQLDEIKNGEPGPRQYASRGAVKINANLNKLHELSINLDIAKDWHVNAHQPLQESLIATEISLKNNTHWHLESISYPKPSLETLRFEKQALALYQGQIQIQARLRKISESKHIPVQVNLQLQTCNQESCLPPETISLEVFERPFPNN